MKSETLPKEKKTLSIATAAARSCNAYRKLMKPAYPSIGQTLFADWKETGMRVPKGSKAGGRAGMSLTFEIDHGTNSLIATAKSLLLKKQKRYSLQDILSVKLVKKITVVEEGYGAICFSLVLERQDGYVELFSTEDEREGVMYRKALSSLLEQYRKQTA